MNIKVEPLRFIDHHSTLDSLIAQVTPEQHVREFVQNSIESGAKQCRIDIDPEYKVRGIFKLSFMDDGRGMNEKSLEACIGALAAGEKKRSRHHNFGMGAKVASVERNPAGVRYNTWTKKTNGCELILAKGSNGEYGSITEIIDGDPMQVWASTINPPSIIKKSNQGTVVTLMGKDEYDNTAAPDDGVSGGGKWIAKYLNHRFFKLPKNFDLRAVTFDIADQSKWGITKNRRVRPIYGMQHYLNTCSKSKYGGASGSVKLNGAMAYWWLLQDEHKTRKNSIEAGCQNDPAVNLKGHFGVLHNNEIYHTGDLRSVRRFGILASAKRVVIYIKPDNVVSDSARDSLKLNGGKPLPLTSWQEEFQTKMPRAIIKADKEAFARGGTTVINGKQINAYLKKQFVMLPPPQSKIFDANGNTTMAGGIGGGTGGSGTGGSGTGGSGTGGKMKVKAKTRSNKTGNGSSISVVWEDKTNLSDYAADYTAIVAATGTPTISLNEDYYLFQEIMKVISDMAPRVSQSDIGEIVKFQTGMKLATSINMIKHLARTDSDIWSSKSHRDAALSREALTSAIESGRSDILQETKDAIKKAFGSKVS